MAPLLRGLADGGLGLLDRKRPPLKRFEGGLKDLFVGALNVPVGCPRAQVRAAREEQCRREADEPAKCDWTEPHDEMLEACKRRRPSP